MKVAAGLVALAALGFLGARAAADTIPIPPLTTVTVPALPKLPVPKPAPVPQPTVPKLPAPVPPAPVAPDPVPVPTVGGISGSGGGLGGSVNTSLPSRQTPSVSGRSGAAGSDSSSSSPARGESQSSRPGQVERVGTSRQWIGTKGRRATTILFVLTRAARVIITVTQVSPVCRAVGHFTVAGHAGVNRLRFDGRFRGKPLAPGTYRIGVRTIGGRSAHRVKIVIVDGSPPSKVDLAAARAANVCGTLRLLPGFSQRSDLASQVTRSFSPEQHASATSAPEGSNSHSGVLGSTAEQAARAIRPVLVALLAAAILLLGLASLPHPAVPGPRLNYLLARHRLEIAGLGAAALVVVAIAFILG